MAKSKRPSILWQSVFWTTGAAIVTLVIVGIVVSVNRQMVTKKFEPIMNIPPTTEYNLDLAGNEKVKTAYGRLEQVYALLTNNPQDIDAALERGGLYLEIKDTARAILAYQWVNREYPKNVRGWIGLGDIYAMVGRISDAKMAYEKALKLDSTNSSIQDKINKLEGK